MIPLLFQPFWSYWFYSWSDDWNCIFIVWIELIPISLKLWAFIHLFARNNNYSFPLLFVHYFPFARISRAMIYHHFPFIFRKNYKWPLLYKLMGCRVYMPHDWVILRRRHHKQTGLIINLRCLTVQSLKQTLQTRRRWNYSERNKSSSVNTAVRP